MITQQTTHTGITDF